MRDGQTNDEQLKMELLSQWKLEAEFRNMWILVSLERFANVHTDVLLLPNSLKFSFRCFKLKGQFQTLTKVCQ